MSNLTLEDLEKMCQQVHDNYGAAEEVYITQWTYDALQTAYDTDIQMYGLNRATVVKFLRKLKVKVDG